jgi:hypothetical protein
MHCIFFLNIVYLTQLSIYFNYSNLSMKGGEYPHGSKEKGKEDGKKKEVIKKAKLITSLHKKSYVPCSSRIFCLSWVTHICEIYSNEQSHTLIRYNKLPCLYGDLSDFEKTLTLP